LERNHSKLNEASPTLGSWLHVSPLVFVAACATIGAAGIVLILLLPEVLAMVASISGVMGGTFGASTWLMYSGRFRYAYQLSNLLLLVAAVILGASVRYTWGAQPAEDYRLPIPPILRWTLAAVLTTVSVWLGLRL
jgi:hypothetical protein